MKLTIINRLVACLAFVFFLSTVSVYAQSSTMTDAHVARIKMNCTLALGTVGRIHVNDAPQFINSNQTYFSIGDKLMAQLNSRLTLNKHDASKLVRTASNYNTALSKFRSAYKTYEETMSELVRMDCLRKPAAFYDRVATAREQRGEVHDAIVNLHELIKQYRVDVEAFKAKSIEGSNG